MAEFQRIEKVFRVRAPSGIPSKKNRLCKGGRGRKHYYDSTTKQILNGLVLAARSQWMGLPPLTDINIGFHFEYKSVLCDPDGWCTATLDFLKLAGVIVDDSAKHILGFSGSTWTKIDQSQEESVTVTIFGHPAA